MWGPAGPDSAGQSPLTRALVYQLVPAGVHHTNTETERPKPILPQRSIDLCPPLTWARRREVSLSTHGAVLSRASRSQTGYRTSRPSRLLHDPDDAGEISTCPAAVNDV